MTTISRREWLRYAAALAAGGAVAGLSGCSSPERGIVVTAGAWPGYEPRCLARQLGWLEARRVRLGEVPTNASSMHVLATGVADAAALTLDEVLLMRSQGVRLAIVLVFNISAGADMLLARPEIRSLGELRGARVALEQGTYASLMLDKALEIGGLTREDVTQVHLAIGDHAHAWKSGEIDAAVTYAPFSGELELAGAHRLFDSRQIPDTIVDVLAVRTDRLTADRSAALRHLVGMHFRTLAFLASAPAEATALIAVRRRAAVTISSAYEGLILPDLAGNRRLLAGDTPTLVEKARIVAESMRRTGLLSADDDLGDLVASAYLPGDGEEVGR